MIDIHCHILPGVDDDGAPDTETSIAMARIAANDGIHTIIATPHLTNAAYPREKLTEAVAQLNTALQQQSIPITILFGAEVQAHIALSVADRFCLAESSFLLVEFPHSYLPADAKELISALTTRSITTIIAHPERNAQIGREPWLLAPLLNMGAKTQITAESLTGNLGMAAKSCAEHLLRNEQVHYLATDSHAPGFRKPILSKAVKQAARIIGEEQAKKLVMATGILSHLAA
jgi:protein-tyrosine phosphatase